MSIHLEQEFTLISPGCCNGPDFAMPEPTVRYLKKKRQAWHCPWCGQGRVFRVGESEEQKQIRRLESDLTREKIAKLEAEQRAENIGRQYSRIRERVKNGVCPCCNRTFENLARHMKTKHPDFGSPSRIKALREAFGLTLSGLADEVGLSHATVSNFERGNHVSARTRDILENWITEQEQA